MGLKGVVSGYPTSTNLPRVDGLSTDPRDLGCRTTYGGEFAGYSLLIEWLHPHSDLIPPYFLS